MSAAAWKVRRARYLAAVGRGERTIDRLREAGKRNAAAHRTPPSVEIVIRAQHSRRAVDPRELGRAHGERGEHWIPWLIDVLGEDPERWAAWLEGYREGRVKGK